MSTAMPRRNLFKLGAGALAGAAFVPAAATAEARPGESARNESVVRKYYKLWEQKDWDPLGVLLTDDFHFTSPQDDHIDKAAFKEKCWGSQIGFIKGFDLEVVMEKGDSVMVEYLCHTQNGKALRNVEISRLRDGKIDSIVCYFGGDASFPSAVSAQKS